MDKLQSTFEKFGKEPRIWYKIPGYVVRNYSPDLEESVLYHMTTHYAIEEPVMSFYKVQDDPISLQEVREWWRKLLSLNITVVALPEDSPGADLKPITVPRIRLAGVNVLFVVYKDDPPPLPVEQLYQGLPARKTIELYRNFSKKFPMFDHYDIDAFMEAGGLSVHPEERRRGLGDALLTARFGICRELGLKATKTVFSSAAAQKVALRCGYQAVAEILYKDIVDDEGKPCFPTIPPTDSIIVTTKAIDF